MLLALILTLAAAAAVIGLLIAGAMIFISGMRGRLADHHPRCRTCGFDLIGHFARPGRCPECGAMLLLPGAVRLGRREASYPRMCAGAGLIVLSSSIPVIVCHPWTAPNPAPLAAAAGGPRTIGRVRAIGPARPVNLPAVRTRIAESSEPATPPASSSACHMCGLPLSQRPIVRQ